MAVIRSHNILQHLSPHNHNYVAQASVIASRTVEGVASMIRRSDSSSTCAADNTSSVCAKPESSSTGDYVIIVAAVVPTVTALIVLILLHRRIRRRQRAEDANDPLATLDFGMDHVKSSSPTKGRKGPPEMSAMDMNSSLRPGMPVRGLSMDLSSPYILPAALNDSHESLQSMSRSNDRHDPYRPVTFVKGGSEYSGRSSKTRADNASVYTASTGMSGEKTRLVPNAARMSRTDVAPYNSRPGAPKPMPARGDSLAQPTAQSDRWYPNDDNQYGSEYSPDLSLSATPATPQDLLSDKPTMLPFPQTLQRPLQPFSGNHSEHQPYPNDFNNGPTHDALHITIPSPTHNRQDLPRSPAAMSPPSYPTINEPPAVPTHHQGLAPQDPPQDYRRVSVMGMRPLPPDDPTDNPEQRANRIRSFYREYFDDSKPNPSGHYPQYDPYSEDYYGEHLDEGATYDPETGAFVMNARPYAEPMTRRAMTPPPRGAPPFAPSHRSTASTQSAGRPVAPPKRIIPPKALQSLPTPHMLKDDSLNFLPTDFAPPTTFRERQLGRAPDSPTGVSRPYSPAFKPHTPLAGSFDDLAIMPNPHALRKSGTFTGLDFAPPGRFKGFGDTASDAGSIRSNRSGISAVQKQAIRAGAYRVSRLPTDMVGTSADFESTLKPSWDMRN